MVAPQNSIRNKLMRVILVTSAFVLLIMFASYFLYEIFSYRTITVRQLNTLGNIIASNSTAALAFDSPKEAAEILSALKAEKNILNACLYDEHGRVFSVYPDSSAAAFPLKPGRIGFRFSENDIQGFIPVNQGDKQLGTLFIRRSIEDIFERLTLYSVIALIIISFCFLLAYFLSLRLQKGISAPIIALSETSRKISQYHDYSIRAKMKSDDEIGLLTDAFNNMLSQIEIQSKEIQAAREAAQKHALELEIKVNERTIEYKKQKDFAEVVVNSSLVLIAVFDTETRIIGFNNKCEEEFGLKKEHVIGKKIIDVLPGIKDSITMQSLARALQGEVVHNEQFRSPITGFYYESFLIPLRNEKNEIYAVLMSAHNITQIVEASENIKNTNIELQRKNSELEQFAYVASHDLQEPLRKIQTFIEMAKNNNGNLDAAQKYMDKIQMSAGRMSSLIKDVLEYSRLSQVQDTFTETDLNIVLEYVKSDFELLISQKGAEIFNDKLPIMYGNKLQLHQLFSNLISNAIKFCNKNPVIRISAQQLSTERVKSITDLDPKQKYFQLLFEDNGIGFEQQYADKIFTIFQRLNTRDKFEGTGIGLALCKKIVENHKGNIAVTSSPGKGTTFQITFPVNHS